MLSLISSPPKASKTKGFVQFLEVTMAVKIKEGLCALGMYTLLVLLSQLNTERFLSASAGLKYNSVSLGNILSPSHGHTT